MGQTTNTILMIRPVNFRMNEQTTVNNYYQEEIDLLPATINAKAQQEFDSYVKKLRAVGVNVIVVNDTNDLILLVNEQCLPVFTGHQQGSIFNAGGGRAHHELAGKGFQRLVHEQKRALHFPGKQFGLFFILHCAANFLHHNDISSLFGIEDPGD